MKKTILFLLFSIALIVVAQAQQDCGAIDCPGRCGRFVDQDGDGFCDHGRLSNPPAENAPAEVEQRSETQSAAKTATSHNPVQPAQPQPTTTHDVRTSVQSATEPTAATPDTVASDAPCQTEPAPPAPQKSPYSLVLITSITLGLYLLTTILVKVNRMKKATHRKIWNVILLITSLVSCLLGFFLVIQINYQVRMDWLMPVKIYHVQFGIAMTIVAMLHILWHVNYWKTIFKQNRAA